MLNLMGCRGQPVHSKSLPSSESPLEVKKIKSQQEWTDATRKVLKESDPDYYREEIAGGPIGMIEIPEKIRELFDENPGQTMTSLVEIVERSDFELVEEAVLQFRALRTMGMYIPLGFEPEELDTFNPRIQMTFRQKLVRDMKILIKRELRRKP